MSTMKLIHPTNKWKQKCCLRKLILHQSIGLESIAPLFWFSVWFYFFGFKCSVPSSSALSLCLLLVRWFGRLSLCDVFRLGWCVCMRFYISDILFTQFNRSAHVSIHTTRDTQRRHRKYEFFGKMNFLRLSKSNFQMAVKRAVNPCVCQNRRYNIVYENFHWHRMSEAGACIRISNVKRLYHWWTDFCADQFVWFVNSNWEVEKRLSRMSKSDRMSCISAKRKMQTPRYSKWIYDMNHDHVSVDSWMRNMWIHTYQS